MSLLVATWTGAIATLGLLAGAGITAWYARKAFREQAEQVKILREQADRDIDQRRRDQATRVFAWTEQRPFDDDPADQRAAACVRNGGGPASERKSAISGCLARSGWCCGALL